MPSAWSLIDASFPTFAGNERVRDQVDVMLNYMFMLAEGLKYQLSNLNAQNFNTTALKNIQIETTADVEAALQEMVEQVNIIQNSVSNLKTSVAGLETWQTQAGAHLQSLDDWVVEAARVLEGLDENMEKLLAAVQPMEDGSTTIGGDGKTVNLVGQIYINGNLIE